MTLSELIAEVSTITNRPDLSAQTSAAVRAATLKIHQSDYYYKDLFETAVDFGSAAYTQSLEYRTLIPRWRAIKYLRPVDSTGTPTAAPFEVLTPDEILDEFAVERTDVCYVAGTVVQIKSSTQFQYLSVGVYLNPDITASGYNSWVALDHPFAIIFEAAAQIFKQTGDTEQFAAFTTLANQQLVEVKLSNVLAEGW